MDREEIENLCGTSEFDYIPADNTIAIGGKNKCGKLTRGDQTYPDLLEILIVEELRKNQWSRGNGVPAGLSNLFSGLADVYVCQSYNRSVYLAQSGHMSTTVGFGLYYSRTNYTIEEDEDYFYVTSTYDLYLDNRLMSEDNGIIRSRVNTVEEVQGLLRAEAPLTEALDTELGDLSVRSIERYVRANPGARTRHSRGRGVYQSEAPAMKEHFVRNILPGIKRHLTDVSRTEISHVPDAMSVCTAFSKAYSYNHPSTTEGGWKEYKWLDKSDLQEYMQEMNILDSDSLRVGDDQRSTTVNVTFLPDGGNHKKHEYLLTKVALQTSDRSSDRPLYAQVICTSRDSGNLKEMLETSIHNGIEIPAENLTPKNLMSEKAGLEHYEQHPDIDISDKVKHLTNMVDEDIGIALLRLGDCGEHKSPKGDTLLDICQFNGAVYAAVVDRPLRLRKGQHNVDLREGVYVVCVDGSASSMDFLWYTSLASRSFGDIIIEEIHSRLTIGGETYSPEVTEEYRARDLTIDQGDGSLERHLSSYRIDRGDLDLGDH